MELLERIAILKIKLALEEEYVSLIDLVKDLDRQVGGYFIDGLLSITKGSLNSLERLPTILNIFLDRRGRDIKDDTQKMVEDLIKTIKTSDVVGTLSKILDLRQKLNLTYDRLREPKKEKKVI